jgi:succinyl-CoA synthetase beta subunit
MNLQEYQGKKLFKNYNISVPQGKLITSAQPDPLKLAKAQFREGKRGKRGLIKPATKENLKELFKHTKRILVEEKIEIEKEFYLSLVVSREEKRILIIFSEKGGIEVKTALLSFISVSPKKIPPSN